MLKAVIVLMLATASGSARRNAKLNAMGGGPGKGKKSC